MVKYKNMSKKIFLFLILIIIVIGGGAIYFAVSNCCEKPKTEINSFEECVFAGYPVLESYPRQCKTPEGKTFAEDIGNELEKSDLIKVSSPRPNQTIESPLSISGEARGFWFFEADFPVKLFDDNDFLLGVIPAQALGDPEGEQAPYGASWMTEDFVPFSATLSFAVPSTSKGRLFLEKDNPSGLPENADELRIPVYFDKTVQGTITLKVFFNNDELDPEFSCNKVFPVEREVSKTQAVARASLEELLKGPTESEKDQGFFTNINPGVKIQSLNIENGVAKVDFDEQLEFQVGGSCRVAAISAQIRETLKQFPTVESVIISINGRTEDILQP